MKEHETKRAFKSMFDKKADPRLRAYFGHVREGFDKDIRTPFYDGKPREEVLNAWQKILEPKLTGMEGLLEFENQLREKVGPLSIMKKLDERIDDIEAYYDLIHLDQKPIMGDAIDALLKDWLSKIGGIRLRSLPNTWDKMRKSTSSGCPYFTKRRTAFEQHGIGELTKQGKLKYGSQIYDKCAILGWRGQEGGLSDEDVKQRVIWMMPMLLNIYELSFYQPFIEGCQHHNLVPAWNGNDAVDEEVTLLFDTKPKDDVIIATDFTKFDQHFNEQMQLCAYNVFRYLGSHSELKDWLQYVFWEKYDIPMAYDYGVIRFGEHGMASGSGGTNADETVSHRCLQLEAAITAGAELNRHSMCLGDDGLLTYPGIDLDHVLDSYTSHGLEMNESKQFVSKTEAEYLRRWYSSDYRVNGTCRGVYSTYRALGKLMGQERFYNPDEWGPEMVALRYLSIIENVKWHPARDEFLEFCVKGDKYRLGLDIPGFLDNLNNLVKSSDIAHEFTSYTGSDQAGINSWWVVNKLKTLR